MVIINQDRINAHKNVEFKDEERTKLGRLLQAIRNIDAHSDQDEKDSIKVTLLSFIDFNNFRLYENQVSRPERQTFIGIFIPTFQLCFM